MKYPNATAVLSIIAEGLNMPADSTLNEILACMYLVAKDDEIRQLLVEACKRDLICKFKEEGIIAE